MSYRDRGSLTQGAGTPARERCYGLPCTVRIGGFTRPQLRGAAPSAYFEPGVKRQRCLSRAMGDAELPRRSKPRTQKRNRRTLLAIGRAS